MTFEKERGASPWSMNERLRLLAWEWCWLFFCRWTPKPFWRWRNLWLRLFGAKIGHRVFVHQRACIAKPWTITLADYACVGDSAVLYSLGPIVLGRAATIAQEAYLCTGTHNFKDEHLPLLVAPIQIGSNVFIGLRAIVLPGITIGDGTVIGAGAVVTKNVPPACVAAGNPARPLRETTKENAS
jgi:putative colanic acid biosynthesis acetyltransferase WcaF